MSGTTSGCGWRRGHDAVTANLFNITDDAAVQMELRRDVERQGEAARNPTGSLAFGAPGAGGDNKAGVLTSTQSIGKAKFSSHFALATPLYSINFRLIGGVLLGCAQ
jgi:hypothetical protein